MSRALPLSLLFFLAAAAVFLMQLIPSIGVILMFMMAMFWSVLLINAGMIGIGIEALKGRVYRAWAIVPFVFYAGYFGFSAFDHYTLARLGDAYDTANSKVQIPFDPEKQALGFEGDMSNSWFTQNYALNVTYSANENYKEGFRSTRLVDQSVCETVRDDPALLAANINTSWFHDVDRSGVRDFEKRFCNLSMPEAPDRPHLRVRSDVRSDMVALLPVRTVTTRVETPDGEHFELHGGSATPLRWLPMPVMGCGLNSAAASWDCGWGFLRKTTPIVSGMTKYNRDLETLARALDLRPVSAGERRAVEPPPFLRAMLDATIQKRLRFEIENVEASIADPTREILDWDVSTLAADTDTLANMSERIMAGVERAAGTELADREQSAVNGLLLASLIANLPSDEFEAMTPRIVRLYDENSQDHWIWAAWDLRRRLDRSGVEPVRQQPWS